MSANLDDDAFTLAEIARTLKDFRLEFRNFSVDVVRKDVYTAHLSNIQMQMDALARDNKRLADEVERGDRRLSETMERDRQEKANDRREVRKAVWSAGLSLMVAIVVLFLEIVIK